MNELVAYYRVSTRRQARSGLGLEAQQAAVLDYQTHSGAKVLSDYTEVEAGKKSDRPQLAKAIAHAKRAGATLVVAKLDRLARNVAFTSALLDSAVQFVCCDNPHANRLTIHILAAVAEDEARRIGERTKSALAAAKRRGTKLGGANPKCRNLSDRARRNGAQAAGKVVRTQADQAYADLAERLAELRLALNCHQTAVVLNLQGHRTRRGKPWSDVAVRRACRRLGIGG